MLGAPPRLFMGSSGVLLVLALRNMASFGGVGRASENIHSMSGDNPWVLDLRRHPPSEGLWAWTPSCVRSGFGELVPPVLKERLSEVHAACVRACAVCCCVCVRARCVCACLGLLSFSHCPSLSQRPGGAGVPVRAVSYLRRNYPWCVRFVCDASYKDSFFLSIKSCLTDFLDSMASSVKGRVRHPSPGLIPGWGTSEHALGSWWGPWRRG